MRKIILKIVIVFVIVALPNGSAFAARIFFEALPNQDSPYYIAAIKLDPQDESINALEGKIFFSENLELIAISNTDGIVNAWINRPQYANNRISFSGIIPGGYSGSLSSTWKGARPGTLFELTFKVKTAGKAELMFTDISLLRNDGAGSEAVVIAEGLSVDVAQSGNTLTNPFAADRTTPEIFEITRMQNTDLSQGKHLIIFNSADKESGIKRYEVAESYRQVLKDDRSLKWHEGTSPYVLKDQDLTSYVYVKAIDNNDNVQIATLDPITPASWYKKNSGILTIIICIFILLVGAIVSLKRKKA